MLRAVEVFLLCALVVAGDNIMWTGGITNSSTAIRVKVTGTPNLLVATNANLTSPVYTMTLTDGLNQFTIPNLSPQTRYYYAVSDKTSELGTFITLPNPGTPHNFTFAFGACVESNTRETEIFDVISKMQPDLFIHLGDIHYEDIATDSPSLFAAAWQTVFNVGPYAKALRSSTVAYTFDDHDFGPNDASSLSKSKPAAIDAYRKHVPHAPLASSEGIYHAFTYGRTRFLVTDTQSFSKPGTTSFKQNVLLGPTQLKWLMDELKQWRNYAMVVMVFSKPWNIATQNKTDCCGFHYVFHERTAIANTIRDEKIDNVIGIAGDEHMLAFDSGANTDFSAALVKQKSKEIPVGGGGGFPMFQSGGMSQKGSYKGGGFDGGCVGKPAFTMDEICSGEFSAKSNPKWQVHGFSTISVSETANSTCLSYKAWSWEVSKATVPALSWTKCTPFRVVGWEDGLYDGEVLRFQCKQQFQEDVAIGSCIANTVVIVFMAAFIVALVITWYCNADAQLRRKGPAPTWPRLHANPAVKQILSTACCIACAPTACCGCTMCILPENQQNVQMSQQK